MGVKRRRGTGEETAVNEQHKKAASPQSWAWIFPAACPRVGDFPICACFPFHVYSNTTSLGKDVHEIHWTHFRGPNCFPVAFPFTDIRKLWAFRYKLENETVSVISGWHIQPVFRCATGSQTIMLAISRH